MHMKIQDEMTWREADLRDENFSRIFFLKSRMLITSRKTEMLWVTVCGHIVGRLNNFPAIGVFQTIFGAIGT